MPELPFARLRVRPTDREKIRAGQFTIFDLVDACFSFSKKRKHLAAHVLALIREEPRTFTALLAETGAQKNALYLALFALTSSGFVFQERRGAGFQLALGFSDALSAYAAFWREWAQSAGADANP